jgi:hypothetical protein
MFSSQQILLKNYNKTSLKVNTKKLTLEHSEVIDGVFFESWIESKMIKQMNLVLMFLLELGCYQ